MSSTQLELQAAKLKHTELGQNGVILLTGTSEVSGNFRKITALTNATFTTLTSDITANDDSTAAIGSDFGTLAAGLSICGKITTVKLATGSALLYS